LEPQGTVTQTPEQAAQRSAAGKASAAARRAKADALRAQQQALAHPDLSTPEAIRTYLELILVGVTTGAIPARAGAAASAVASRLLKSHELSIEAELKELRAAREQWEKAPGQGVTRRHR
jgi:hypothetical protein